MTPKLDRKLYVHIDYLKISWNPELRFEIDIKIWIFWGFEEF